MIHLFVAHTPLHLLFVEKLIAHLDLQQRQVAVYYEGQVPAGSAVEARELPGYADYRTVVERSTENATTILRDVYRETDCVTLYCSDLKWLTNNAVYFGMKKADRRQTILFPDGLGSYLPRNDWVRLQAASLAKAGLGLLGRGPKYRPLIGDHFGMDARYVSRVYGPKSHLLNGNAPKQELPMAGPGQKEPKFTGAELLFLGVPMDEHRFPKATAEEIVCGSAKKALSLCETESQPIYKPHHFESPWISELFVENGFVVSADRRAAEIVVSELAVPKLVGYYSSALALAPAVSSNPCRPYSVSFDPVAAGYMNDKDAARLKKILADFGVDFIDE